MIKKITLLSLGIILFTGFMLSAQTGPSQPGQESLNIFAGSGQNQILFSDFGLLNTETLTLLAASDNNSLFEVTEVRYIQGQSFATIVVIEKGSKGTANLEINLDDGTDTYQTSVDINIIDYDNKGLNFEIHDIIFWQEEIPLNSIAVFDTIIDSGAGPYNFLNYDNIPITVNLDCQSSPPCTGHDFYTAYYKGYIVPPVSGTYYFYMESSDRFGMWISSNENYTGMQNIIYRGSNRPHVGESVGGNRVKSAARELVGGKVYAVYATQWIIHSTYGGILWEGPDINTRFIEKEHILHLFDNQKPTTPANLKTDWIASDQAQVSWGASNDNKSVAGYNLYLDGIRYNEEIIKETHFRITDLEAGNKYQLVVTAADQIGNESYVSNTLVLETFETDDLPPTPPQALEVLQVTGLALHLKWSGAEDSESTVIAYNIYVDGVLYNTEDFVFQDNIIVFRLQPTTEYTFTLEAVDAGFNISEMSQPFTASTIDFDPLGASLGEKRGRIVIHNKNISWNEGFGLNVPYENGSYPNNSIVRDIVKEFGSGAVRWGAITANSRSFAGSTGTSPSHNNTYARMMNHANQIGAYFALTVGVSNTMDYMTDPETFLRLMEYLNGPATTTGGARRAAEGFSEPLLPNSPGVILEFGNEVWGAAAHNSQIGSNYDNYAQWVRDMSDLIRTSPYYDSDKIIMAYSGRYPHPASAGSSVLNEKLFLPDRGHAENLAVSGYLGGNLNYDPEIPPGNSELDYYKNGIEMSARNMQGLLLTMTDMLRQSGYLKTFYLYESNMTTTSYNGRFGQAIVMTDYLAAGMKYGSIVPTVFHLTGGQWRITRPAEDYKRLPLFETGKYFNRFCKGHILETEFVTNNTITNSNGQLVNWEPVGAYAFNKDDNFSILLINRDFEDTYTVQVELPGGINFSPAAKMYTIWNDDFSSFETNIDSLDITLIGGMLVNVPKHAMVIISSQVTPPQFAQLPHGYFDRIRADSIYVYTDGNREITSSRGIENIFGQVFPESAFSRVVRYEVIENTANAEVTFFASQQRLRVRGTGVCGDDGYIKVLAFAADNHEISDTVTIHISNQGTNCNVSTDDPALVGLSIFYPNPATDRLFIDQSIHDSSIIEVYDVSGRRVKEHRLVYGYEFSIEDLHSGLYMVRIISSDGKVLSGKLKKQ